MNEGPVIRLASICSRAASAFLRLSASGAFLISSCTSGLASSPKRTSWSCACLRSCQLGLPSFWSMRSAAGRAGAVAAGRVAGPVAGGAAGRVVAATGCAPATAAPRATMTPAITCSQRMSTPAGLLRGNDLTEQLALDQLLLDHVRLDNSARLHVAADLQRRQHVVHGDLSPGDDLPAGLNQLGVAVH